MAEHWPPHALWFPLGADSCLVEEPSDSQAFKRGSKLIERRS